MRYEKMKRNAVGGKDPKELAKQLTRDLYEIEVRRSRAYNQIYKLIVDYRRELDGKPLPTPNTPNTPKPWPPDVLKNITDNWKIVIQTYDEELNLLRNFENEGVLNTQGRGQLARQMKNAKDRLDMWKEDLVTLLQKKSPAGVFNIFRETPYTVARPDRPVFSDSELLGVKKDADAGTISRMYFYLQKAMDPLNKVESFAQKAKGETAKNYAREFSIALSKLKSIEKAMYSSYME